MEYCKWHTEPELNIPMHRNRRYGIVGKKGESLTSIGKELYDLPAYERQVRCHSGPLTVSRQLIVNRLK